MGLMKNFYLKFLFLFFFIFVYSSSKLVASHIMGGEIIWDCRNDGKYVFTVKVYRDCQGANLVTGNQGLQLHNYPNTGNKIMVPLQYVGRTNINASCNTNNGCSVQEYIFTTGAIILTGTPGTNGWIFTWTSGNRNAAIDNIQNADDFGITLR